MSSLAEWRDADTQRRVARQGSQLETAKLLVTLALGAAGAIVASALQAARSPAWTTAGVILGGCAFVAALAVLGLDRSREVDETEILLDGYEQRWSDERVLQELRIAFRAMVDTNEDVVRLVKATARLQVTLAFASAACASTAMLL